MKKFGFVVVFLVLVVDFSFCTELWVYAGTEVPAAGRMKAIYERSILQSRDEAIRMFIPDDPNEDEISIYFGTTILWYDVTFEGDISTPGSGVETDTGVPIRISKVYDYGNGYSVRFATMVIAGEVKTVYFLKKN